MYILFQLRSLLQGLSIFCCFTILVSSGAVAQIQGSASAVFETPLGPPEMVTSGVGTNVFAWGDPADFGTGPSELIFNGNALAPAFDEIFALGTLTFFNGTIAEGTAADAVFLNPTVDLTSPPKTIANELFRFLIIRNTPNTSDPRESADSVFLPNFPHELTFEVDDIPVSLEILGFGNVSGGGFVEQNYLNVLENDQASADLIARFSTACVIPPGGVPPWESLLTGNEPRCGLTGRTIGTLFRDQDGNRLDLFCQSTGGLGHEYALRYVKADGTSLQVGRCPWVGGRNTAEILHTGDYQEPEGVDCVFSIFWRSVEAFSILNGDPLQVDWKTYHYFPRKGQLILRHFKSLDGPGRFFQDTLVKEAVNVDILDFNPDPGPGDEAMFTAFEPPCDIDRNGVCDDNDIDLVDGVIGECKEGENYNELADANHDGCVTPRDKDVMLSSDFDGDGVGDFQDSCLKQGLSMTVIIDDCDSGVPNHVFDDGCAISDLLGVASEDANNHGNYVSEVSRITNRLKLSGLINGTEKGAIQSCAARARIP